jgi:hypothetical protein
MRQFGALPSRRIAKKRLRLPIGKGMSDATPEPRTPVMIMVEASWVDHSGKVQKVSARIENKSSGGACIRLSRRISVGTQLMIEGKWEKFSGEARYCRKDGRDYLVGIQRDKVEHSIANGLAEKEPEITIPDVRAQMEAAKMRQHRELAELPEKNVRPEAVPTGNSLSRLEILSPHENPQVDLGTERRRSAQAQRPKVVQKREEQIQQLSADPEAGRERKHMRRKWFELGHKDEQEALTSGTNEKMQPLNCVTVSVASEDAVAPELRGEDAEVELMSMEDIYRMAGIMNPRKGYSISKIVEMLHSEHLRGLSKEMKRASVLMALDAAGVSVDEVLQDAKARQDAIDSYEVDQRKQFEAQLAQKADENVQIQAELERVKARYTERLRRNLDGMAREKATFGNWLTLKQQEAQSMAEAVDLCLKPLAPETPRTAIEEVTLAGARVKPV